MIELTASYVTLHGAGFAEPARTPFAARAAAAANAGFAGIGVQLADVAAHGGVGAVATVATDAGLAVTEAEFLGGWALTDSVTQVSDAERTLVDAARAWGPLRVTSGEFAAGPLDPGRAAANLAAVADRLAPLGATLAVEAFAWGAIPTYPSALDLVRRSGAPNVGVMVDVWHWFGTGADVALLADVDVREIVCVQLNDGPRVAPDDPDMLQKARSTRWLPGTGELPVRELVAGLRALGYAGPWSVEVNDPWFRALPTGEAARRAFGAATDILAG